MPCCLSCPDQDLHMNKSSLSASPSLSSLFPHPTTRGLLAGALQWYRVEVGREADSGAHSGLITYENSMRARLIRLAAATGRWARACLYRLQARQACKTAVVIADVVQGLPIRERLKTPQPSGFSWCGSTVHQPKSPAAPFRSSSPSSCSAGATVASSDQDKSNALIILSRLHLTLSL